MMISVTRGKSSGVVLDTVDLKHYEGLVEQTAVHVLVECQLVTASFVELFQKIVVGCQVDSSQSVLITDFRYAPCTELIEAVET